MNFLRSAQNRLNTARKHEAGFTLVETLVSIALLGIFFYIIISSVSGTDIPRIVTPMIQSANNLDLKPAQQATGRVYKGIEAFTRDHPDTPPTKTLLTADRYVSEPSNVVWAFNTYGGPANKQMCVIAYTTDDTTDYSASNPAAYDSSYQYKSIGQNCKHQEAGNPKMVPNWDTK